MRKKIQLALFALAFILSSQALFASALSAGSAPEISAITATSSQVRWITATSTFANYITYGLTSGGPYAYTAYMGCDGIYTQIATTGHCVSMTNLMPNTTYYVKVLTDTTATAGTISSTDFPENHFTTVALVNNTTPTPPLPPTGMTANLVTTSLTPAVQLSWIDNSTNEDRFVIMRSTAGSVPVAISPNLPSNATQFTDTNVTAGASYTYAVKACLGDVCSTTTYPISVTIPSITQTAPSSPTSLGATFVSPSSAILTWTDTSSNETSYQLYKGTSTASLVNFTTLTSDTTTYTDTNLAPATYYYTITACNSLGCSSKKDFSSVTVPSIVTSTTSLSTPVATTSTTVVTTGVTSTTIAPIISCFGFSCPIATSTETSSTISTSTSITTTLKVPPAPYSVNATRLFVNGVLSKNIRITWNDSSGDVTRFRIYRSSSNSNQELPAVSALSHSYDDNNILPGIYTYYVSTCNTIGCSLSVATNPITISELVSEIEETSTENLLTASNTISIAFGKVTPGSFISITSSSKTFNVTGMSDGTFAVRVPDGIYVVEGLTPFITTERTVKKITILATKVVSVTEETITSSKKIVGKITLPSGEVVTDAEVSAYKKSTGEWLRTVTDTTGHYSLEVTSGSWDIIARPKNTSSALWEPSLTPFSTTLSTVNTDEVKEVNVIVNPLLASVNVIVKDELGEAVPGIGITLDTLSSSEVTAGTLSPLRRVKTGKTDTSGSVSFNSYQGNYFIRTLIPNTLSYLETPEQKITTVANQTKTITFVLKKEKIEQVVKLTGIVTFDTGYPINASVSLWSNEGGHAETTADSRGFFSLNLTPNQTWHIRATKDDIGKSYITDEQTFVTQLGSPKVIELVFTKNDAVDIAPLVSVANNITEQSIALTNDGTRFNLPANGVSGSGTINVEIKPTAEAPSRSASSLVSTAYDITVKNTSGQAITKLVKEAEITIPYDEKDLQAKGVNIDNVIPSYYDESISAWVSVSKFTVNKERKVFVLLVDHLTRFALIAAADTIAPSSPTNIVTDAVTPTDVKISWNNPTKDFSHAKVYRSELLGSFGKVVATEIFSNSFIDKTNSTGNKVYYYTVRSVDTAGNESTNSNQIAYTPKGSTLASSQQSASLLLPPGQTSSGQILRQLSVGSKGDDVTALQKALKYDGFYATGPITGYYGKLTENAVFRFQNYYKQELLIPNGYKLGTGVLGPITRKKINEIIATSGQ